MSDAFAAIDNGSKLRRPDELPFDLCFGGRRQFCNSDYADLGKTQNHKVKEVAMVKSDIFPCLTVRIVYLDGPCQSPVNVLFLQAAP